MSDLIEQAITEFYGERCDDYLAECVVCTVWKEYDTLRDALEEEIRDYMLPKMKGIYTRLNGGSDDMRDEGHKLELIYRKLQQLTKKEQA